MLKLVGYSDRLSVAPGETVKFMVSAEDVPEYRASIVRLIHGDANPENVLLDPETRSFTGFIDFSDAIRAPRVFDVAIAASYLRSGSADPGAIASSFGMERCYRGLWIKRSGS